VLEDFTARGFSDFDHTPIQQQINKLDKLCVINDMHNDTIRDKNADKKHQTSLSLLVLGDFDVGTFNDCD